MIVNSNNKYKEKLEKLKEEAITSLEPVIKEHGNKLFEAVKDFANDLISDMFEKRRKKNK